MSDAPTPSPPRPLGTMRLWLCVVARLVPASRRAVWREEWESEVSLGARPGAFGVRRYLDVMLGALRDALDVRREPPARRNPTATPADRYGMPARALDSLRRDARHAMRRLWRSPIVPLGVVGTLALGIGANAAIFAVADTVLLRTLPYPAADRLYMIWESGPQATSERTQVSVLDFLDWRTQAAAFDDIAGYGSAGFNVDLEGRAVRVDGHVVSSNFFELLGATPAIGRGFLPLEDDEGRGLTAVVSHDFWLRELAGDPAAIGTSLGIGGISHTVVGVMPSDFRPPADAALWLPLGTYGGNLRVWRATHVLTVIGRLGDGTSPRVAETELTVLAQDLWEHAPIFSGWRISVRPLRTELYGDFSRSIGFLWVAGVSLLLVMCANLANLFLAEGMSRRAEFALRSALGARRGALLGQTAVEIAILAGAASAAGLLLASLIVQVLATRLPPAITVIYPITMDARAAAYALTLAAVSAVLFGFMPAMASGGANLTVRLHDGGRGGHARGSSRLRNVLVGGQIALSLALLVTTLLTLDSHRRLRALDPGFQAENVTSFRAALAGPDYATPEQRRNFYRQVESALSEEPGVIGVGMGSQVPFIPSAGAGMASVFVVDRVPEPGAEQPVAETTRASPGLLAAIGVRVTRGRGLQDGDDQTAPAVALVNRAATAMLWPDTDPLGARIRTGRTGDSELLIVGVVEDMRHSDLRRPANPQVFLAAAQFPPASQTFVIRTNGTIPTLPERIRSAVRRVDPTQPIYDIAALRTHVDRSLAGSVLSAQVLSALAVLAITLAAVGIYAVIAVAVSARTREFSVRRALGARSNDVLRLVLREGAIVTGSGLALGCIGAAIAARLMASQLFDVSPLDPRIYSLAALALGLLALGAALVPALKAARVHPARALRGR